jgi:FkbM family methyltransferase
MNFLPIDILEIDTPLEKKTLALLRGDASTLFIRRDGTYEKHFLALAKMVLKEGDYAVDMGANLGYHTLTMAKLVGNAGRVFAFEPQRITFQQLNCNIFLNKLDNVYTFNAALGEEESFAHIEQVDYYKEVAGSFGTNIGNTSINLTSVGDKISKKTLDSLDLPRLNFIKIDIQGCELLALMGARNTITKHKPILFVEIEGHHLVKFKATPKMLIKYIRQMGYRMYQIKNEYPVDHLCIPEGQPLVDFGYPLEEVKTPWF